jgi:putative SOS response-associated peptidase YedK
VCGRYVSVKSDEDLTSEFDVEEILGEAPAPSWNVAPTDNVRIIAKRKPHGHSDDPDAKPLIQLRTARWGLIPSWTKPPASSEKGLVPNWSRSRSGGVKMINARSETVTSKPAFKSAAARRRCLAPALGYYEWQQADGRKIPYFLHAPDDSTLAMAGLYEIWHDDSLPEDHPNAWLWTCTIVTRPASDTLGHVHDRCPVLVPPDLREQWLDCSADDPLVARRLLDEIPEPHLVPRQIGRAVGNVRNNGPELIAPVHGEDEQEQPQPEAQRLF